jgi:hypothetical protein
MSTVLAMHAMQGTAVTAGLVSAAVVDTGIAGAALAVVRFTRRVWRTLHAVITITRRHVPAWLGVALAVALAIPGPVDELIVLIVVAGFAAAKPVMRAELRAGIPAAWRSA